MATESVMDEMNRGKAMKAKKEEKGEKAEMSEAEHLAAMCPECKEHMRDMMGEAPEKKKDIKSMDDLKAVAYEKTKGGSK